MSDSNRAAETDLAPASAPFTGFYYDGKTSAHRPVSLLIAGTQLSLQSEAGSIEVRWVDARLAEPSKHAPLLLNFPDGSHCEFPYSQPLRDALQLAGVPVTRMSGLASVLEGNWRLATLSAAFLVAAVMAFYVWILPEVAAVVAPMIPQSLQARLGHAAMDQMESRWFEPSGLPVKQQEEIHHRFEQLLGKQADDYEMDIRKSSIGPNATTLPGNIIVLTDELVTLVDGDLDTITGVLAHELGHAANHHVLRSVIQASALTVLGSVLIGDYSSVLAAVPATLGQLRYNRKFEAQADAYARDLLCKQHIDPASTAKFFDRILARPTGDVDKLIPEYLRTHPGTAGRAAFFRSGC